MGEWDYIEEPENEPDFFHTLAEEQVDNNAKLIELGLLITGIDEACEGAAAAYHEGALPKEVMDLAEVIKDYCVVAKRVLNG